MAELAQSRDKEEEDMMNNYDRLAERFVDSKLFNISCYLIVGLCMFMFIKGALNKREDYHELSKKIIEQYEKARTTDFKKIEDKFLDYRC